MSAANGNGGHPAERLPIRVVVPTGETPASGPIPGVEVHRRPPYTGSDPAARSRDAIRRISSALPPFTPQEE